MQQFFTSIWSLSISYYDNCVNGQTVLFIHGNSQSSQTFRKQFNSPDLSEFRLIALDLPGHGDSSFDTGPEVYSLPYYNKLVFQFIAQMGLSKPILVGHSLGGHIILENPFGIELKGIFLSGTPPVCKPFDPSLVFCDHPASNMLYRHDLSDSDIRVFANACFSSPSPETENEMVDIKKTDPCARAKLGESVASNNFNDEVVAVKNLKCPLALLCGEQDHFISSNYLRCLDSPRIWNGQTQFIRGGHNVHLENSDVYNLSLRDFILESEFSLKDTDFYGDENHDTF